MWNGLAEQVEVLRAAVADSCRQMASAHQSIRGTSVRTESRDGRISVTVDGGGQITELVFKDDSYQDLNRRELSEKLMLLFREAQSEARRAVLAHLPPSPLTGTTAEELLKGDDPVLPNNLVEAFLGGAGTKKETTP
jgi:DNA-binding protein YbaB